MNVESRRQMVTFVVRRLGALLQRPDSWGTPQAVELQMLLLLEMWHVATGAGQDIINGVSDRYDAYLDAQVPGNPVPLGERLGLSSAADGRFVELLHGFVRQERVLRQVNYALVPRLPRYDQPGTAHLAAA